MSFGTDAHLIGEVHIYNEPSKERADGRLCSVMFEVRHDTEGECHRQVTAWKATKPKRKRMPKMTKPKCSADEIAAMASRGEDISA